MANNQEGWAASSELNRMRKNPLFNQLRAQSTIDTGRYGNLQQDVINYSRMSAGRESLNKFGSDYKGLYLPGSDNIGPQVNRRLGAAMGTSSEWAMPKLHDPFEWFRERCILPGELMNLQDGQKKVEDVVVGDIALTHKGRYRKVIGLGHKPFDGKAYSVEPYYLSKAKVTVDHPFWAKKNLNDEPDWIKVQHLSKKDWVFIPVDREVVDVDTINILDHLDANDWVVEDGYITQRTGRRNIIQNKPSVEFEVTEELMWLMGMYIAEGVSDNKKMCWYLSNKEIEYRDKIIDYCKQVFKIDARYSESSTDNTTLVELSCQPIATLFKNWFGDTAYDKHLPDWIMHLPKEKQLRLLEGWLDGDGCYTPRTNHTFSVSAQLTEQMRMIMLRCGYFPSKTQRIQRKFDNSGRTGKTNTQLLLLARDQYQFLEDTNNIDDDGFVRGKSKLSFKPVNGSRRFPAVEDAEGVWVQIRNIEEFDYQGEIYYFTVAEDHSFTISDQGVRNTWWFNMEDPDEQTRKIRDWCNTPEAPILMGDLTFKPIGEVQVGDEVMGWEYETIPGGNKKKAKLVKTKVLATNLRVAPEVIEVTMSSGKKIKCTPDHKWFNYNYSPSSMERFVENSGGRYHKMESTRLQIPGLVNSGYSDQEIGSLLTLKKETVSYYRNKHLRGESLLNSRQTKTENELWYREWTTATPGAVLKSVVDVPQVLTDEQIYAAGYISAMLDGEGTVGSGGVIIYQSYVKNLDVCDEIAKQLNILGLSYKIVDRETGIRQFYIQGDASNHNTRQQLLNLYNWGNSVKLSRYLEAYFVDTKNFGSPDTVVSTTSLGEGEVVSMQTETGNYIAWGYASKNCRLIYTTHYLVPSMIDIYARFPLLGMEFSHPDKRVNEFFSELFWDGLQYQDFLYSLSREHWLIGDVFALGSWNDGIGAWEADELINPNDVIVAKNRALRTYQYHIKVPEEVKKLVETRQPEKEYAMLMAMYPDVVEYARKDVEIPVSDVLMKGMPFKCVVPQTKILTPSGPVEAKDLKIGDPIIAWDTNNNIAVTSYVENNFIQPKQPIIKLITKNGREIETTLDHPFWSSVVEQPENIDKCLQCNFKSDNVNVRTGHQNGKVNAPVQHFFPQPKVVQKWVDANQLKVGDRIRVGTNIELKSNHLDLDMARFIGIMIGDGSYTENQFALHNIDQEVISWADNFVKTHGCHLQKLSGISYSIKSTQNLGKIYGRPGSNNLINTFKEYGIWGQKFYNKRIPKVIWEGGTECWWEFLSGYLDTDGCVGNYSNSKYRQSSIVFTSANKDLLEDVQLMLSLLGISSKLSFSTKLRRAKKDGPLKNYPIGRVIIEKSSELIKVQNKLTPLIKKKDVNNLYISDSNRKDISDWDVIKSIEIVNDQETCALTVAGFHNHITAGLLTHNTNPWAEHGTPILMRAFRQLMMEESLQASMEAIADRLYSPLILATLGLPDADQDGPWIPDAEELGMLRDDLATAINADFRLMVYHHGLQIQNAFGRESMPRLDTDFYRIQANYMMVFGIGSELLQGGKSGATYASGALNRELITQMLTTHQHQIKHFIRERMRAVAERQGFYEYRNVGGHPVPIMETVLVVDEETGAQFVEERPKLAIPDVIFQSMSLQDENIERQFLQQLAGAGFPVSFQTFTRNAGIDFEDEVETRKKEKIDMVIAEQQVKKDIFDRCFQLQLPIPMEYQQEYEAYIMQLQDPQLAAQIRPGAIQDLSSFTPTPNMSGAPVHVDAGGIPDMYPSIANQETLDAQQKKHPPESHEQKKTQPKRSKAGKPNGPQKKTASVEDLEDGEILVVSKKTNENIIFEDGDILSNVGAEGNEWGKYRKTNPKKASVTEEFSGDREVSYGDTMKFSVPWESHLRVKMKIANGQKIVIDDNYEKYDELYMKNHIAKILEANVVGPEDNDFNDKLNEQPIPTNMDFDHHQSDYMGFDQPAITGVNPEDMGPKVTFGSQAFPNRKKADNNNK